MIRQEKFSLVAALKPMLPALLIALPAFVFVCIGTARASWASLGRDQGIFQYVAWAVSRGDVLYRDVRDVNGPVITMVHVVFQSLGGEDEHCFRSLDLIANGLTFAIVGALIPSIARGDASKDPIASPSRIAWALAAWVTLTSQYIIYGFWDTAQRESFLDWFVLLAIALQAAARELPSRRTRWLIFASGAMSFVPWLGKPTFALFTLSQMVALLLEKEPLRARGKRVAIFVGGGVVGAFVPFVFLLIRGDFSAFLKITLVDVPTMYRFIWPRPAWAIVTMPGYDKLAITAVATTVGLCALIIVRRISTRALPIAMMPTLGLVSVVVQGKGFPYHFHPVTLGVAFAWLVAIGALWESGRWRLPICAAALLICARSAYYGYDAPYVETPASNARDHASLESAERLAAYDRVDYFPRALRDAAEYIAKTTAPSDRVQSYGMDAYVLFLAKRKSATPYIYAYDLNADAALHGSFDPGGAVPNEEQTARIRELRDAHARDLLERLIAAPPAAFVFVDRSPLMSFEDAVQDFAYHCPDAAQFLSARYQQTASFDGIRVWLRNDLRANLETLRDSAGPD